MLGASGRVPMIQYVLLDHPQAALFRPFGSDGQVVGDRSLSHRDAIRISCGYQPAQCFFAVFQVWHRSNMRKIRNQASTTFKLGHRGRNKPVPAQPNRSVNWRVPPSCRLTRHSRCWAKWHDILFDRRPIVGFALKTAAIGQASNVLQFCSPLVPQRSIAAAVKSLRKCQ
jgi:hypothetical protein